MYHSRRTDNYFSFDRNQEVKHMFWDKVSGMYDLFETLYNGKVYAQLGKDVAEWIEPEDTVLECACGTGEITGQIASLCRKVIATDYSLGMLRQAKRKCRKYSNVKIRRADMTNLKCRDNAADKVVAGNVIHLLEDPRLAIWELERVCKPGGNVIIPTYINIERKGRVKLFVKAFQWLGAEFRRQFDYESYQELKEGSKISIAGEKK